MKYLTLFTILLSLFIQQKVSAQQCSDYPCVIKKVKRFIADKKYTDAFDNLESADGYPAKKADEISALRKQLFAAIEKEKKAALKAVEQMQVAQIEKTRAEMARKEAIEQLQIEKQTAVEGKNKAEATEAKAKAVLDKIYFYEDKFGLAYDKEIKRYGFIDKNLNTKIDFKYTEAFSFDEGGFAKVKTEYEYDENGKRIDGKYYLIDTFRNEYLLALEIHELHDGITALDLRNKNLKTIPPSVFEQKQLKIFLFSGNDLTLFPANEITKLENLIKLNLGSNQLTSIPNELCKLINLRKLNLSYNKLSSLPLEIGKLTNLVNLNLRKNQLTQLPSEIGRLTLLTSLNLMDNQITKEEQEKIKKLLPNCKIQF